MIAAMANLLDYDVYDLELTSVKDNTELRRLLTETTAKSIIVIEDIDCSLDLTGQRTKRKEKSETESGRKKVLVRRRKRVAARLPVRTAEFHRRAVVCLCRGETNCIHNKLCRQA
ncbi:UNVERIFIED_CONTAM: AAA-ATPase ASD, mitochondrial [Sesamum radiatum]|uniref:AAA-ATPase ASD, mitochondrial n=1 Tax=Sesamum radiatum TaxID=300843 RepID=A0AAW2RXR2_SESRA